MITAITLALVGLISLQVTLLMDSYEQKEQAFDRNVLNALNAIVQQLEKEEAASKIFTVALEPPPAGKRGKTTIRRTMPAMPKRVPGGNGGMSWIFSDSAPQLPAGQMRVEVFHSSGIDTVTSVIVRGNGNNKGTKQSISYSYTSDDSGMHLRTSVNDAALTILKDTTRKRRGEIVARVVDKLFLMEMLPIEQRLTVTKLDSLIKGSLYAVGITVPYTFRVTVGKQDSVRLTNDTTAAALPPSAPFRTRLFPNDVLSPNYELSLVLPDKASFVLGEMLLMIGMSLVFISIVIVSFIYTVRVIILQKRFSASVIDFINNMTHEFKTPISTIALASEAIAKPEVLSSKPKVRRYNALIADENNRMKHQVDTILQMALLEQGEFELKTAAVDMHDVIRSAAKNFSIQTEHRNGSLTTELNAHRSIVHGDAVHLGNIIHNLLDNAVKYSPALPAVTVKTMNEGDSIVIRISDNGIGIGREHLHRVFDKYFRVPTGTTHDVKGFGLGLSYVKLIAEAHNGSVAVQSAPGSGTTVELTLPV